MHHQNVCHWCSIPSFAFKEEKGTQTLHCLTPTDHSTVTVVKCQCFTAQARCVAEVSFGITAKEG